MSMSKHFIINTRHVYIITCGFTTGKRSSNVISREGCHFLHVGESYLSIPKAILMSLY